LVPAEPLQPTLQKKDQEYPAMKNKIVLVTGSTDGIGRQTALDLAGMGARVILHGRSQERLDAVREDIRQATGSEALDTICADFSSLKQVRSMASSILQKYDHLDVLISNAATYMRERVLSEDGYEMTFAVNYLAAFLLINQLVGLLKKTAPARIVIVSSVAHSTARIDFENLQGEKEYKPWRAYALSKLCNILFSFELAQRLNSSGVTANCLHPGVVNTKLLRASFDMPGSDVREGSKTSVYLASSPQVEKTTGKYFVDMQLSQPSPLAQDGALRQQLWQVSERLVGIESSI
jgi:NAD(P)-dependent dehydrogenase (short-subunit alcohol dehydrogenase family)